MCEMLLCRILFLLGFTALLCDAAVPPDYYTSAEGKTGATLRQALQNIIRNHTVIPYSSGSRADTSDALKVLDEDPSNTNNVILLYAQRSEPKSTFGLTTGWNREHMWPNSYGLDDVEPAYSDLHNLRAEDANVNSARGNEFYDESSSSDPPLQTPGHAEAPLTSSDSNSWEPPATVKGDVARAMFYMAVRYTGDANGEPALFLTNIQPEIASTTNLMGRLTTLLIWHAIDPVDDRERLRNDRVFALYQHNRNPFVDRPEWVLLTFAPQLGIARSGEALRLTWPAEFSDARVQGAGPMFAWQILTDISARSGVWRQVIISKTEDTEFFRLLVE